MSVDRYYYFFCGINIFKRKLAKCVSGTLEPQVCGSINLIEIRNFYDYQRFRLSLFGVGFNTSKTNIDYKYQFA